MNVGVSKNLIITLIKDTLESELVDLGGFSHANLLLDANNNIDIASKFVIFNNNNEMIAFLFCGYSRIRSVCSRNLKNNVEIKMKLGDELGAVLLTPIVSGDIEGIEYSVWPYCNPLGSDLGFIRRKIQLFQYRPLVLNWLRNVNEYSISSASEQEKIDDFVHPLQRLMGNKSISMRIKDEIEWQISCVETRSWTPYFVLAHNDLWEGNLLVNKYNVKNIYHGLTVIDWAGGSYRSFAIYDLVRISISLKVSRTVFLDELLAHCAILHCDKRNAMGYLLASFAFLAENLDQFPEDRFIQLLNDCFIFLDERVCNMKDRRR